MTLHSVFYLMAVGLSTLSIVVHAEVVFDGTLGTSGALQGPDFAVDASSGQQVGTNLFHSFETFNLNSTESATFTGPSNINNVISRVTGGQVSQIDGFLKSFIPNADLYFLNPAGVMFGPNAAINVPGSLYVSTADYLKLGDTGRFDVTMPNNSSLTVAPPSAFGFLDAPSNITVENSVLSFPNRDNLTRIMRGEDLATTATLSLVGGDITIKDNFIITGGNDVHLISVASPGEVPINPMELTDNTFAAYGTLSITDTRASNNRNFGNIDTSGFGGGAIFIRAGQVVLDNGWVFADTWHNKAGRSITIHANDFLTMKNGSRVTTEAFNRSQKNGFGPRNIGNGGNITLLANDITLTDGSQIQSTSKTKGNAGNIAISAQNTLSLIGADSTGRFKSGVLSNTVLYGKSGEMKISAQNLVMEEGATMRAETWGLGEAGNLFINVDNLTLSNGAQVNVSAGFSGIPKTWQEGTGKAGQLTVVANKAMHISASSGEKGGNSGFFSNVLTKGQGGTIDITTPNLIVTEGGTIQTGSQRWGDAGNIVLNVDTLNVTQAGFITAGTLGEGLGGSVNIQANHVHLSENGFISASSLGQGDAGSIKLALEEKLTMNKGFIQTAAKSADGGNIEVTTPSYLYLVDSEISTSVGAGLGGGGNVTLQPKFVIQDHSPIIAEAYGGPGGNIQITTTSIYQFPAILESRISASSQFGKDGIVVIDTPDNNADEAMLALSSNFLDVSALMNTPCSQKVAENLSSFVVVEREGASETHHDDLLPSGPLLAQLPTVNSQASITIEDSPDVFRNKFSMLTGCRYSL
ncbi:filamentous hemagglutinin N-terminal domain-containing protein [Candidatus Parabeggiatoa sp. HSG14]|uniref:two-partner secretion domain-containing protein n=1 Tax=Candidatus Parabeggiatoa sp. HSG14 TaxID=3055593 RepID=UPI0025A927E0|nr:filamentous hemagglutinin N-terminal domain-containing protein [Thiotrichales bacterium HSG14]